MPIQMYKGGETSVVENCLVKAKEKEGWSRWPDEESLAKRQEQEAAAQADAPQAEAEDSPDPEESEDAAESNDWMN